MACSWIESALNPFFWLQAAAFNAFNAFKPSMPAAFKLQTAAGADALQVVAVGASHLSELEALPRDPFERTLEGVPFR